MSAVARLQPQLHVKAHCAAANLRYAWASELPRGAASTVTVTL